MQLTHPVGLHLGLVPDPYQSGYLDPFPYPGSESERGLLWFLPRDAIHKRGLYMPSRGVTFVCCVETADE